MGYDMYLADSEAAAEIDSGLAAWLRSFMGAHEPDDETYFRANIWSMGTLREAMEGYGMLAWGGDFTFPRMDGFKVPRIDGELDTDSPEYERYRAACQAVVEKDTGGVLPGEKFCSNDGWLVTPTECQNALKAYREAVEGGAEPFPSLGSWDSETQERSYWNEWLAFLMRAIPAGGFRVW